MAACVFALWQVLDVTTDDELQAGAKVGTQLAPVEDEDDVDFVPAPPTEPYPEPTPRSRKRAGPGKAARADTTKMPVAADTDFDADTRDPHSKWVELANSADAPEMGAFASALRSRHKGGADPLVQIVDILRKRPAEEAAKTAARLPSWGEPQLKSPGIVSPEFGTGLFETNIGHIWKHCVFAGKHFTLMLLECLMMQK